MAGATNKKKYRNIYLTLLFCHMFVYSTVRTILALVAIGQAPIYFKLNPVNEKHQVTERRPNEI